MLPNSGYQLPVGRCRGVLFYICVVRWARPYFFSSLKMFKNVEHRKNHKKPSTRVQNQYVGVQNHDFWVRKLGSKGAADVHRNLPPTKEEQTPNK